MSKNLEIANLLDFYGGLLTEKQLNVVDLYYNEDLSLGEIAEHEHITRQGVRDSIKRGEKYLLELEEKLHMLESYQKLSAMMESIAELSSTIYDINDRYKFSGEIAEKSFEIRKIANKFLADNQ